MSGAGSRSAWFTVCVKWERWTLLEKRATPSCTNESDRAGKTLGERRERVSLATRRKTHGDTTSWVQDQDTSARRLQIRFARASFAEAAVRAGDWMLGNLFDGSGFFHYQIRPTHRIRIPYMRWSQAWGVRALAELRRAGLSP